MKTIAIFFIASASYSKRIVDIVSNPTSCLFDFNFSIVSSERGHLYNYNFDSSIIGQWWTMLPSIYPSLLDNLELISHRPTILPRQIDRSHDLYSLPQWLHPRELSYGDLSVISKHHQALVSFLRSHDDYCLICEDDVIFSDNALSIIHDLVQNFSFDFVDIAGGDGLTTSNADVTINKSLQLEKKSNFATRTACCYLVSRRYAEKLSLVLRSPVFPIDWSMSFAFSLFTSSPLVYWVCNNLAEHGSSTGKVISWRSSQ